MPRRGENVYRRKDGRWEGRYIKGHTNSKAVYGYVYARSYSEVKEKLRQHKESISRKPIKKSHDYPILFEMVYFEWLSTVKPQLKHSTIVKYLNVSRLYLLPNFSGKPIESISRSDIIIFANTLLEKGGKKKQGLSPKTINDILSV